jgi:hypothetical protein
MSAQHSLLAGVSFGGVGVRGFALEGPGDPEIWTKQSAAQQTWIADTMRKLNDKITQLEARTRA